MAPRRLNLSVVALASAALLVAGCGAGSANPGVARLSSGASGGGANAATSGGTSSGGLGISAGTETGAGSAEAGALAFAGCMRANGVPHLPDPQAGGGFLFHTGADADPSSPAFKAAQAKCKKFLPPGPGSGSPPSVKTLAHYLTIARCMRSHGA
jgi:hypothetical protein